MNTPALKPNPIDSRAESTHRQHLAADPLKPVWVGASAGSGKTKVLVDRLLRLMLPAANHIACPPHRILCITFTKAAAAEVLARITSVLSGWAIADTNTLTHALQDLLKTLPDDNQIQTARALFARVLDAPGGMKIMTIHSFCQSVLARFPMEAGLPAGFDVMDDTEARALMRDIRRHLIVTKSADPHLESAFDFLSTHQDSDTIESLMEKIFAERARISTMLHDFGSIDAVCNAVYATLNLPAQNPDSVLDAQLGTIDTNALTTLASAIDGTTPTLTNTANALRQVIAAFDTQAYLDIFFTQKREPRKPAKAIKDDPALLAIYEQQQTIGADLMAAMQALHTAQSTTALLRFGTAALAAYESEKRRRNTFDFEDLIAQTRKLLSDDGVHWVQFKLDGGIDHILVDEAQDTNPDQWDIITALYNEFYDGDSRREDTTRTTFVVGDEKQSIYSFQRADPRIFDRQRASLNTKTSTAENPQRNITLNASFRSGASILQFVDTVFAPAAMRQGVLQHPDDETVAHQAANSGMPARVEIWPLIKSEQHRRDNSDPAAWDSAWVTQNAPTTELATRIAATIKGWLDNGEILESHNRPIRAGDILILLAKRNPMAEPILRALRAAGIPVTGIDRMVLAEQIAVQDALAAISFALNPDDDLTLATLLKSPFIRMDEQTLFALAHNRPATLWDGVRRHNPTLALWLNTLLEHAGLDNASAFLHHLFYTPCPASDISGMQALLTQLGADALDPLQELLASADAHLLSRDNGLQHFLQTARHDTSQIKRQIDATDNRVRLMTVHGAKGLEAPIVFLPDTMRRKTDAAKISPLQFPARDDKTTPPLWSTTSDTRARALAAMVADARTQSEEEYRRLLYVALTRPATRLYICGAQNDTDGKYTDQSWYHACAHAMDDMEKIYHDAADAKIRYIKNDRTAPPKTDKTETAANATTAPLPAWAHQSAPAPEYPPRPLMPSRATPDADEPATMSPLAGDTSKRFKRGTLIHTLFQFLPALPVAERRARARAWLARPVHKLDEAAIADIESAIFNVLENPAYAPLFDAASRAEVPLTGMLGNNLISGQIDRLRIDDASVTILDYKTNRPAAKTPADVAPAYKTQLRLYRDLLATIYPEKTIKTMLLWTDGPNLMDMTLDL